MLLPWQLFTSLLVTFSSFASRPSSFWTKDKVIQQIREEPTTKVCDRDFDNHSSLKLYVTAADLILNRAMELNSSDSPGGKIIDRSPGGGKLNLQRNICVKPQHVGFHRITLLNRPCPPQNAHPANPGLGARCRH